MSAVLDCPTAPMSPDRPRPRGGGPRTPEGKEASRRNALKHGLRSRVLLPDDLAATVTERTAQFADEFGPRSPYEQWLVGEMARATAQLDRCAELAVADLQRTIDRALLCWEEDRRAAVEDLGARLPKDPARIRHALGRSRQGADWLIERWEGLGEVLQANGGWNEDQRRLAFDLLGVAPELRQGSARVPPEGDTQALAALVARQVARLREDQEAVLDGLDEASRAMSAAGMPIDEDAANARLRRYEASCRRALRWAHAELRRVLAGPPAAGESSCSEATRADTPIPPAARPAPARAASDSPLQRTETAFNASLKEDIPPPAIPAPPVAPVPVIARVPAITTAPATAPRNRRERRAQELQDRRTARNGPRAAPAR